MVMGLSMYTDVLICEYYEYCILFIMRIQTVNQVNVLIEFLINKLKLNCISIVM